MIFKQPEHLHMNLLQSNAFNEFRTKKSEGEMWVSFKVKQEDSLEELISLHKIFQTGKINMDF